MKRNGRISVALPAEQLAQLRQAVESGEFGSKAAVVREALRAFHHRRLLHAGAHGVQRLSRTLKVQPTPAEPFERVELLFDAGDAKA